MRVSTGTVVNGRIEVPGERLPEGVEVTILSPENQEVFTLGAEAEAALLARIDEAGIDSNVSIKLTQFGLEIDPELAYRNARRVVDDAARRGNFVRVDMEGSNVTQATIDVFNGVEVNV